MTLAFEGVTERVIPYFVNVDPPLGSGRTLNWRKFLLNNFFPLSLSELAKLAGGRRFPEAYKVDGKAYYGRVWDVLYEMESIQVAIHFPRKVTIRSKRAAAFAFAFENLERS